MQERVTQLMQQLRATVMSEQGLGRFSIDPEEGGMWDDGHHESCGTDAQMDADWQFQVCLAEYMYIEFAMDKDMYADVLERCVKPRELERLAL